MSAFSVALPEAEEESTATYNWYEAREPGLGEEFLECVDAAVQRIRRNPLSQKIEFDAFRRILVRRFPYAVYYEHVDDLVIIFAVLHCGMNPRRIRRTVRGRSFEGEP